MDRRVEFISIFLVAPCDSSDVALLPFNFVHYFFSDLDTTLMLIRWEACVPIHQEAREWAQVPRHREEDPRSMCRLPFSFFT